MANVTLSPITTADPRSIFQELEQIPMTNDYGQPMMKKDKNGNKRPMYETLKTKNLSVVKLQLNGHLTDTPEAQPALETLAKLTTLQLKYIYKTTCKVLVKENKHSEIPDELEFDKSVHDNTMWYAMSKGEEGKTQFRMSKEDSLPITFIEYKIPRPQASGFSLDLVALAKLAK